MDGVGWVVHGTIDILMGLGEFGVRFRSGDVYPNQFMDTKVKNAFNQ